MQMEWNEWQIVQVSTFLFKLIFISSRNSWSPVSNTSLISSSKSLRMRVRLSCYTWSCYGTNLLGVIIRHDCQVSANTRSQQKYFCSLQIRTICFVDMSAA